MSLLTALLVASSSWTMVPAEVDVPRTFAKCASRFLDLRAGPVGTDKPFDCTRKYFDELPGSAGSTHSMGDAATTATDVGLAYANMIRVAIETPAEQDEHTREEFVRAFTSQRLSQDDSYCRLRADASYPGTISSVVFGACRVKKADALIDDLLDLLGDYDREAYTNSKLLRDAQF